MRVATISRHALRRAIERMSDISDLPIDDEAALQELQTVYGIDLDGVRKEIMRAIHRGVALGAPVVRWRGARFMLSKSGVVRTVIADKKFQPRRARVADLEDCL